MAKERRKPNLFDQANFISKLTFWWLNPLFSQKPLAVSDESRQYDVPAADEADLLERRLERWWKKEVRQYCEGGSANLKKAVLYAFLLQWICPGLVLLLAETARLCQPVLLSSVLGFVDSETTLTPMHAYFYGFGLCCMLITHVILRTLYLFMTHRVALKMKTAIEALLYRKVVSLSSEASMLASAAVVVEQFSTNRDVFTGAMEHVHYLWVGPIQVAMVMFLLHNEIGSTGLLCLVLMTSLVVLHALLELAASKLREKSIMWSNQRWQLTNWILSVMIQIKIYCLESALTTSVYTIRSKELSNIRVLTAMQGFLWSILGASCRLLWLFVILTAVNMEVKVSVRAVFTSLVLLDMLMWCLHHFPVPGVKNWLSMQEMFENIQTFLLLDEEKEQIKDLRLRRTVSYRNEPNADWIVDIDHMTARWPTVHTGERKRFHKRRNRDSTCSTKSLLQESDVEHAFSLKYISLQVKKGELLALVGPQQSGKTSLLMTLTGELPYEIGQVSINGKAAFCTQEPWLFSGSVRENVLFGESLDTARYEIVVKACALTELLEVLPERDETQVGPRGLELSTSYKAKITLARAVYNSADVYLLDDIFSYLDNQTRQDITKWCLSDVLASKTRIMVTQNLQFLKAANRIAVLREGSLYDIGSYEDLQSRGVNIREFIASDLPHNEHLSELETEEENFKIRLAVRKAQKENIGFDISSQSDLQLLFTFLGRWQLRCVLLLLLLLWLGAQVLYLSADWMLASWISTEPTGTSRFASTSLQPHIQPLVPPSITVTEKSTDVYNANYLHLFGIFVILATLIGIAVSVATLEVFVSAGKTCHDSMLKALMKAKVEFFLTFSTDSVLSTFSHHLSFIDTYLPGFFCLTIEMALRILGVMVMLCVINPWMIMAVLPVVILMTALQVFGARTLKGVCMLRDVAQEPVKAVVTETLQGLQTIRAFKQEDHFVKDFDFHLNLLTWSRFLMLCVHCRLLLICMFVIFLFITVVINVSIILVESVNSGLLALGLSYCVCLPLPVLSLLGSSARLKKNMVSVRQAMALKNVEEESAWSSEKPPPEDWPNRGSITFSNTSLLAGPSGPYLLRNIGLHIRSKEKVGVVGEAGSGKNFLVTALLRLGQVHGMLFMDGFDILKIGLHELRRNISVIPKNPVLFPGTLRFNLDLSGTSTDEQLWGAVEQVGLRDKVAGIRGGLSADMADTTIFNIGERQLLYLARAMIKKTRLVLFDEAVDHIERGLNDQIQRLLRAKFRDCTVLTIAHHLSSVMDCDRLMVFSRGEVREFDTPHNLLKREDGYFTCLVEQCGRRHAQHLRALAELSHNQRASASLMLEHAVFMATEQLNASTEDLNFQPGSLAWSNLAHFSKSQDSLEKAHIDWGSRGDIREAETHSSVTWSKPQAGMAPAQKLINKRRASPNRGKKIGKEDREEQGDEGAEQMPLLVSDATLRAAIPALAENVYKDYNKTDEEANSNSKKNIYRSVGAGYLINYRSSSRHQIPSSASQNPSSVVPSRGNIDTPPAPRRNFSPFPFNSENTNAALDQARDSVEMSRGRSLNEKNQSFLTKNAEDLSKSAQISQGDTEKVIYC